MSDGYKGIILAGGTGSRLYPATAFTSKQLLPVYDKPMIYYPLSTLLAAGIGDILVITSHEALDPIRSALLDGSMLGARVSYAIQLQPKGIAEALIIAEKCGFWDGRGPVTLILGDNIFDGPELSGELRGALVAACRMGMASIFTSRVARPERYGVLGPDRIVEKPPVPPSRNAVTGLYVYPAGAHEVATGLEPSPRGELEITDVNNYYLEEERMKAQSLGGACTWFDAGTPDDLLAASQYVAAVQKRQGRLVGSPEVAAVVGGFMRPESFQELFAERAASSLYLQAVQEELA